VHKKNGLALQSAPLHSMIEADLQRRMS